MDELIIEDKKYVSSKRAADLTGYAKDYVGQLAREGYVEARRVGRSWYVLESAIQDHRFGSEERGKAPDAPQKPMLTVAKPQPAREPRMTPITWESPKYEAEIQEELPSINLLRREAPKAEASFDEPQPLEDAWQTWFETYRTPVHGETAESTPANRKETPENIDLSASEKNAQEDRLEVVPVHVLPDTRPATLPTKDTPRVPLRHVPSVSPSPRQPRSPRSLPARSRLLLMVAAYFLMLISSAAFLLGTGYFDKEIISNKQASYLGGITVYEKISN